jgi:hypothetical protein
MIAADAKVLLYQDSNGGSSSIHVSTPGPGTTISSPQNWNNVVAGSLGVEYAVTPMVPVRVGYSLSTSATPYSTVGPFGIANTLVHGIHAGAGLIWTNVNVDVGGMYAFDSTDVANANPAAGGPVPGNYATTFVMIGASGTYHY